MIPYIKSLDVFGHPITINLNQSKGAAHKTIFGGLASALIKVALLIILIISIQDMFLNHNSKMSS